MGRLELRHRASWSETVIEVEVVRGGERETERRGGVRWRRGEAGRKENEGDENKESERKMGGGG